MTLHNPLYVDSSTGLTDAGENYVDSAVAVENIWDVPGTTVVFNNSTRTLDVGSSAISGGLITANSGASVNGTATISEAIITNTITSNKNAIVNQLNDSGAIPALELLQADDSEGFINFVGTSLGAVLSGTTFLESLRIEVNGTPYRIPLIGS